MKMEAENRGEEGTTPVTTACPEAEKEKCEKKKNACFFHSSQHCVPNRKARMAFVLLTVKGCVLDIELIFAPIYIQQHWCRADASYERRALRLQTVR